MGAKRHDPMTVEDFLALDREKLDQKYEFRNGHMVAIELETIDLAIPVDDIYEKVILPPLDPLRGLGKRQRL